MRLTPVAAILALIATTATGQEIIKSHGISAFGDLKYPADFPHFDYVNPDAPQGGTMSFRGQGASRTFDSLNPFILKGEWAQGIELIHDTLFTRAYDELDAAYGQIAESIEYPEDRSWVIFDLRPEAKFSDGEQIEASDIKFTMEVLKDKGSPIYQIALKDVTGVEVLSATKAKVTFAEGANTRDLIAAVGDIEILPEHYYADVAFEDSTLDPPVSSGEYRVEDADPGRSITYCKDPEYWGASLPVNIGQDNFQCVRYEYFGDNTAAFEALKSGNYLFHEEFSSKIWGTEYEFPSLEKGWVKQEILSDGRPSGAQGFWLNLRRPIMQDVRVRQALGLMFNFEWSNETLFYGSYGRTDSFFENSEYQAEGMPRGTEAAILEKYQDQIPSEVFSEPAFVPNVSSTRQLDRSALRKASAFLDDAGWPVGSDGKRRNSNGVLMTIEFVDDSPGFERIVLPFISNLERLGVDARFELIDSAQMEQRQEEFDYDIAIARLVPNATPSNELRQLYSSESADRRGTFNLAGLQDPAVDGLVEEVITAETREDAIAALKALDRVLRAKHIWVSNWTKGQHWLAYWDVFGKPDIKPAYIRGDRYWWWDETKYQALKDQGALR